MSEKQDFSGVTHYTQVDVQPGGINIQHVEHLHQADILQALGIELEVKHAAKANFPPACAVPEKLKSEEAKALMEDLVDTGMLTKDWQPIRLSGSERALVAKAVCDRLDIKEVWQVFGQLWNEKPETLRSYLNKALEQKKSLDFQEKLKNILD